MASPTKYTQAFDFSDFAADNPSAPLPGTRVDIELAAIQASSDEVVDAIADVRRSDGALKNGIVTADSLAADLSIGFTMAGTWAVDTVYAGGDGVAYNDSFYKSRVAHTATLGNAPAEGATTDTWMYLFSISALAIADGSVTPAKLDGTALAAFRALLVVGAEGIVASTNKATPADADMFGIADSADSDAQKKLSWANLKAGIFSALGALIIAGTAKTTLVDADSFAMADSAAASATKQITWSSLKTAIGTALGAIIAAATGKSVLVDADVFVVADSAASSASKKATLSNLKTYLTTSLFATLNTAAQVITGGARVTSYDLGTPTAASTVTLDPGNRPLQHLTNNAAFTLAPGSNGGSIIHEVLNGGSAGAITTSGFTKVDGSFTTTNGSKFICSIVRSQNYSYLNIRALQ